MALIILPASLTQAATSDHRHPRLFGIVEILEAHSLFSYWPRPAILTGIPNNITGTRGAIGIIDTHGTIDIVQPAPFGVVEILDAFDIRD